MGVHVLARTTVIMVDIACAGLEDSAGSAKGSQFCGQLALTVKRYVNEGKTNGCAPRRDSMIRGRNTSLSVRAQKLLLKTSSREFQQEVGPVG